MLKKVITIEGQNSSEAKPVAMLVQVASQYESTIYLETGSKRVNAKSIMGMMTLALMEGIAPQFCLGLFSVFPSNFDKFSSSHLEAVQDRKSVV